MAATNYDACEARVLASEGGYTNNPHDPGGPTNWGITIYDARLYWKRDATAQDVRSMPKSVAQEIYKKKYWDALNGDQLPAGLDYTVFDYGVNSGIGRAGRILRQCIGMAGADWHVTPDVIARIALDKRYIAELIREINSERVHFLEHLSTWATFGRGWLARVNSVEQASLHMATTPTESPPPAQVATADIPSAKAVEQPQHLFAHLGDDLKSVWSSISTTV